MAMLKVSMVLDETIELTKVKWQRIWNLVNFKVPPFLDIFGLFCTSCDIFWLFQAFFDNILKFMGIFGHFWILFGHLWTCLGIKQKTSITIIVCSNSYRSAPNLTPVWNQCVTTCIVHKSLKHYITYFRNYIE